MKKIITFLFAALVSLILYAQAPQKMSYQAVIRDASNELVTNANVGIRITILQGSPAGNIVYQESQTVQSNQNGLISMEIGGATGFDTIHWQTGPYFIKTEVDPNGGTNYTITGVTQLLSVPYALYAKTAENVNTQYQETDPTWSGAANENDDIGRMGNVGIGTTSPSAKLDVVGNGAFTGTVSGADAVNNNEFITKGQLQNLVDSSLWDVESNAIYNKNATTTEKRVKIENNGNVKINKGGLRIGQDGDVDSVLISETFPLQLVGSWSGSVSIPDANCYMGSCNSNNFTEVSININDSYSIQKVVVEITIFHTYDADLNIWLVSPAGTSVCLSAGSGYSGDNYINTVFDDDAPIYITQGSAPFTGTYKPISSLSLLNGQNVHGTWRLRVCDNMSWDIGTITLFNLYVKRSDTSYYDVNVFPALGIGDLQVRGRGNFVGRVSGADAVNNNEFVTKGQISGLETDPVFTSSAAANITNNNITNWNYSILPQATNGSMVYYNGTNWAATNLLKTNGNSINVKNVQADSINAAYIYTGKVVSNNSVQINLATGLPPLQINSSTKVNNLNVDMLDDYHAGNASGNIPVSNGTVNNNLNADMLDGKHANEFSLLEHDHGTGTVNYITKWTSSNGFGNSIIYDNGTNVGLGNTAPTYKLDVNGNIRATNQLISSVATGTAPLSVSSSTKVNTLNVDLLDDYHAGNASGNIPVSNGTLNNNLNSDMVDGYHAGNSNGYIPVSNGTLNMNLNSDMLDGYHAGIGSGNIPVSNGTVNINLNADMLDGKHANEFSLLGHDHGTGTVNYLTKWTSSNGFGNSIIFDNGTNVGLGNTAPTYKLDVTGTIRATGQLISSATTGTAPFSVSSSTKVNTLNVDLLDDYHAGNASGNIPVSNGTLNNNLNSDMLDGYHAGNSNGNIPVSNGTVNTNLNADMVDGYHANQLTKNVSSGIVPGGNYVDITIPNYFPFFLQLSSGHPYGIASDKGGQALIQGFINDSKVGLLITYSHGANFGDNPGTGTVYSTYKTADTQNTVDLITFGGTTGNIYKVSTMGTAYKLRLSCATGAIELYYKLSY